jgi:Na+/H+-dicarboxylate symporter
VSGIRSLFRPHAAASLVALVAGAALGTAVRAYDIPALHTLATVIEPVGTLWVNAIRMTLIPLVVALLVTSVTSFADARAVSRLGGRAIGFFVALLAGTALFSALAAPPLFELMAVDQDAAAALRNSATRPGEAVELPTVRGFFLGLIPANPLRAAVDGAMLPLIVFVALFALALAQLNSEQRRPVVAFFETIGAAMTILIRWILALTPIGVFALALGLGVELGLGVAGAVGYYVLVVSALLAAVTLALYPVVTLVSGVPPNVFARAAAPAQMVAASSRSSLASLPALIEGAKRAYGDRPGLTGLVLPLAASTFRINTPVSHMVGPLFLASLYGVDLAAAQIATIAVLTMAMSFSNPGIPSGGLFVIMSPILMSVGLPIDGVGLLLAVDVIPDLFATVANVTGDMAVATMVARSAPLAAPSATAGVVS